jgi:hypothetical protein
MIERDKCLRSFTKVKSVGVRVLEGINCTKCTICIISLVIKWQDFCSEGFYKLWMIRVFDWYEFLRGCSLWGTKVMHKI